MKIHKILFLAGLTIVSSAHTLPTDSLADAVCFTAGSFVAPVFFDAVTSQDENTALFNDLLSNDFYKVTTLSTLTHLATLQIAKNFSLSTPTAMASACAAAMLSSAAFCSYKYGKDKEVRWVNLDYGLCLIASILPLASGHYCYKFLKHHNVPEFISTTNTQLRALKG